MALASSWMLTRLLRNQCRTVTLELGRRERLILRQSIQPVNQLVAITRTASCRLQHPSLDFIGLLRDFETFSDPTCALPGAADRQEKQDNGESDRTIPQGRPHPWGGNDPGEQGGDHRRPHFQSSSRAYIVTAIPPSATAVNTQRSVSR